MTGSVVIVTGASQGIGRATALRLAQDFAAVVLVARSHDKLLEVAGAIDGPQCRALVIAGDLSQPAFAGQVVDETLAAFGRIDALVNIAGAVPQIDLMEMGDEQWEQSLALKFHGARRLTLAAWPALRQSGGAVVLMSGNAAEAPRAPAAAIGVINAAINALAKAFADRGIADGVQVNSISPGAVLTERRRGFLDRWASGRGSGAVPVDADGQAIEAAFARQAGIARLGLPEEIASLVGFLVSPGARWMTGSALRMDGGEIRSV